MHLFILESKYPDIINLQSMGKMEKRHVYWGCKPNVMLPNRLFLFPYEGT